MSMMNFTSLGNNVLGSTHMVIYDKNCKLVNMTIDPIFSLETAHCVERRIVANTILNGAIFLTIYIIILTSLFIGTAIVCDDYFVPSLDILSEKLNMSSAVAGATLMAGGSSAPEFWSACISIAFESDVGVGTITGSAIFNLLVIVACTAVCVKKSLKLDWRPLIRDSFFYCISLCFFIFSIWDTLWSWWEALVMVIIYVVYILAMVFDKELMAYLTQLEKLFTKTRPSSIKPICQGVTFERVPSSRSDNAWIINAQIVNRHRNMSFIFTDEQSIKTAKSMVLTYSVRYSRVLSRQLQTDSTIKMGSPETSELSDQSESTVVTIKKKRCEPKCCVPNFAAPVLQKGTNRKSKCKNIAKYLVQWFIFVCGLPFIIIFTYTIPDCTREEFRHWYLITFLVSLIWIAIITFGLVKIIVEIGCIIKVHHYLMSVVFLAAGTSIPDLLSSVIVAREGHGDMAVSNALGSNVFDINFGIGLPLLIITAVKGDSESVFSTDDREAYCRNKMKIHPHKKFGFILLFVVVLAVCVIIWQKFHLTKKLGITFVTLYLLFLAYAFFQQFWCNPRGYIC